MIQGLIANHIYTQGVESKLPVFQFFRKKSWIKFRRTRTKTRMTWIPIILDGSPGQLQRILKNSTFSSGLQFQLFAIFGRLCQKIEKFHNLTRFGFWENFFCQKWQSLKIMVSYFRALTTFIMFLKSPSFYFLR